MYEINDNISKQYNWHQSSPWKIFVDKYVKNNEHYLDAIFSVRQERYRCTWAWLVAYILIHMPIPPKKRDQNECRVKGSALKLQKDTCPNKWIQIFPRNTWIDLCDHFPWKFPKQLTLRPFDLRRRWQRSAGQTALWRIASNLSKLRLACRPKRTLVNHERFIDTAIWFFRYHEHLQY